MSDEMDEVGPTMPCSHTLITVIDGEHRCADCGAVTELRTASGKIITPAEVDQWVDEAEAGYEPWKHPITRYPKKWRRR